MIYKKLLIFALVLISSLISVNILLAQPGGGADTGNTPGGGANTVSTSLTNPLGVDSPEAVIANVINTIFGIVGSLALLMFIYGGLVWMTSSGNKEMIDKGKNIIKWAAIGLIVIFSSYALVRFLITGVGAS